MDAPARSYAFVPPPPPPAPRVGAPTRTPKQEETLGRVNDARVHARRLAAGRADEAMVQWHREVALYLGALERRAAATTDVAELAAIELEIEKHVLAR